MTCLGWGHTDEAKLECSVWAAVTVVFFFFFIMVVEVSHPHTEAISHLDAQLILIFYLWA